MKLGQRAGYPMAQQVNTFHNQQMNAVQVLEFVKDFANDDETLIAGTNAPATREVIEQTAKWRKRLATTRYC